MMLSTRHKNNATAKIWSKFGLVALGFCFKCTLEMMTSSSTRRLRQEFSLISDTTISNRIIDNNGWGTVNVFRGPQLDLDKIGNSVGFSQIGQDEIVLKLLHNKQDGYFVDLAANHAVALSNTYRLEAHHGWKGICVEPNTRYQSLHLHRNNCTLVQAIVGAQRMEKVSVILPQDIHSAPGGGIVRDDFDNKVTLAGEDASDSVKKRQKIKPVDMYTVPLTEILDRLDAPPMLDYLSLDVEGAEYYVMQSFAFEKYKIRVMTIERPGQELVDLLYKNGYVYLAAFNIWGDETLFALKSELPSLDLSTLESLHKGTHKKMEVIGNTLNNKPRVL